MLGYFMVKPCDGEGHGWSEPLRATSTGNDHYQNSLSASCFCFCCFGFISLSCYRLVPSLGGNLAPGSSQVYIFQIQLPERDRLTLQVPCPYIQLLGLIVHWEPGAEYQTEKLWPEGWAINLLPEPGGWSKGKRNFQRRVWCSIGQSSLCSHHRNNSHFTLCIFILTKDTSKEKTAVLV